VLLIDEGNSARQVLQTGPQGVVRAVCVGFVDSIDLSRPQPGSFGG
jgi:microcompartment protein CcmK/EutM